MDEMGIWQGIGVKEHVLGPAGQKVQYQQQSGDCKNITMIATICTDGTSIAPAVIYKGHLKSGYIDGEIRVKWIKQFDHHMKEKAAGISLT
ncbi:hypothetical protein K466DRAFT_579305 [Polyporus arcularius HHB13444]|uniref:DDE-1 domain-containing protein n=1 Tax=Polyporus arcularius HHB13444 TaxID=1314778 RepID=A0A5C3NQ34_9APHY|nr:hypothetical protein K466DRAFT_579305 [Polyporus arcularius HHB13444]